MTDTTTDELLYQLTILAETIQEQTQAIDDLVKQNDQMMLIISQGSEQEEQHDETIQYLAQR